MTAEPTLPQLNYDWYLLGNAEVAGNYLAQGKEGIPFVRKSLELILQDAGVNDPWIVQTVTDPEVLSKTIRNQLNSYNEYRGNQTVGDLVTRYKSDISDYLGDGAKTAFKELDEFTDKKDDDILEEIKRLKHIIEGKEYGRSTEEETEQAKGEVKRYEKVRATFGLLESFYRQKFRSRVEEEVTKDSLRTLYQEPESEEE